jgi:hypothetical protein
MMLLLKSRVMMVGMMEEARMITVDRMRTASAMNYYE